NASEETFLKMDITFDRPVLLSTFTGRCIVAKINFFGFSLSFFRTFDLLNFVLKYISESIIVSPTRYILFFLTPSLLRFVTPIFSVTRRYFDRASVTILFTSSGMVISKLLSPASTCATGIDAPLTVIFEQTSAQAI